MDFDEPLSKVDYWCELEKQVIDKKQKEQENARNDQHLENKIVHQDINTLTDAIRSENHKKEILKAQFGMNETMIKNKRMNKSLDGMNNTVQNFFPFGKGEKIMNLFGKGEKINIMPIEEIIDLNSTRKEQYVQNTSKLTPC